MMEEIPSEDDEIVELPITGELDLHTFRPKDLKDLIPDYLEACRERSILEVRVIHGKGVGHLRRSVHAILSRLEYVDSFALAHVSMGGWGATMVYLRENKTPSLPPNSVN